MFTLADTAAAGIDMAAATPFVASISSLGFAIWFAYYTVSVTLPIQQKEHREEREQIRQQLLEVITRLETEMRSQRESYERWKYTFFEKFGHQDKG